MLKLYSCFFFHSIPLMYWYSDSSKLSSEFIELSINTTSYTVHPFLFSFYKKVIIVPSCNPWSTFLEKSNSFLTIRSFRYTNTVCLPRRRSSYTDFFFFLKRYYLKKQKNNTKEISSH